MTTFIVLTLWLAGIVMIGSVLVNLLGWENALGIIGGFLLILLANIIDGA